MTSTPQIQLNTVAFRYPNTSASGVDGVSLAIEAASIVAIIGESGSGKSTLLKLIYGLLSPQSGVVLFEGERVWGPDVKLIPGHERMKMVTQDFELNTYAKVYDNIASMLPNTDLQRKESETRRMMELLRIQHLGSKRVVDLSGGERQRVAIARAMITDPAVLLLDEPFSQVDTVLKSRLRDDLRVLADTHQTTIILVTHDPEDGLSIGDELVILKDGQVVERGGVRQLYEAPAMPYTARLLANANILTREQANTLGIDAQGEVAILPEWITPADYRDGPLFTVGTCVFKGFYDEVTLVSGELRLKSYIVHTHTLDVGAEVGVHIRKVHLF